MVSHFSSVHLSLNERMSRNFLTKTGWLVLTLGAIATSSLLSGCSSSPQNQASPNPSATNAESMQGMDHSNMGSMNHSASMDLGPADTDFDLRFVDAMAPHHQGAVEMAKEAQQKSKRPEIQKLAAGIIKSQDKEINQMKQWRQAWYPNAGAKPVAYNAQMRRSMPMSQDQRSGMMMRMDLGAADEQFDLRFVNAMIPHHEGAVVMAKDALTKSKRAEIKNLSQDIVSSQDAEIKQMQQWRQAWYKQ